MNFNTPLEFDQILQLLAQNALSDGAKARCLSLCPTRSESEAKRWMDETTQARRIVEQTGTPPLSSLAEIQKVADLVTAEAMLLPDQLMQVSSFLVCCRRMKAYLKKAESTNCGIAWFGGSIDALTELEAEIDRCIRNGVIDTMASARLNEIRRQMEAASDQIKIKLEALLRKNKAWFSEQFVSVRNGHHTLPVKRECKHEVVGTVVELSNSGGTCFIEPASVCRLQTELAQLRAEEENEIRRILYALTALVGDNLVAIKRNVEAMETLDFLFAKGKLSFNMLASPVGLTVGKTLLIHNARHPLLNPETAVPLHFSLDAETRGVVITGPNTGGKTVALKTVGLLSLMAQSGLHIPANELSCLCMHNLILCDIGDGQSIAENLSTFSAHMKNILMILDAATEESLVLLDELGSGTDPAEGMGLAIAVLDELCKKGCQFLVTTHYPEVKEYAANKPGLVNARMAFDKESLMPLYRLEIGQAGESCALYIAQRLGMPSRMLQRAQEAAYGMPDKEALFVDENNIDYGKTCPSPALLKQAEPKAPTQSRASQFNLGDSVFIYPQKEIGIVFARVNERGQLGIQVKGAKKWINHKRVKLHIPASELYPDNYDFSILFDSVADRKARHIMRKRHEADNIVIVKRGENE